MQLFNETAFEQIPGQAAMNTDAPILNYDSARRPITEEEAVAIAESEYSYRGTSMLSMGADGGMHFRGEAYSPGAARGWAEEKRRGLVRKIMAGDARFSVFYDSARDRFYCG